MKIRYVYFAAAVAFLVGAVVEILPPRVLTAAVLDVIAGAIFLFLAVGPQASRKPTK